MIKKWNLKQDKVSTLYYKHSVMDSNSTRTQEVCCRAEKVNKQALISSMQQQYYFVRAPQNNVTLLISTVRIGPTGVWFFTIVHIKITKDSASSDPNPTQTWSKHEILFKS